MDLGGPFLFTSEALVGFEFATLSHAFTAKGEAAALLVTPNLNPEVFSNAGRLLRLTRSPPSGAPGSLVRPLEVVFSWHCISLLPCLLLPQTINSRRRGLTAAFNVCNPGIQHGV